MVAVFLILASGVFALSLALVVASLRCSRESARLDAPDAPTLEIAEGDSARADRRDADVLDFALWAERHR